MLIVYPDADPQLKELLTNELLSPLRQIAEFRIYEGKPTSHEEYVNRVKDADGLLLGWSIPNEVLQECPNLKVISFTGIGASNFIDLDYATKRGIIVTNTPGYADHTVAEHALTLLLALSKNLHHHHRNIQKGKWDQSKTSTEIRGKTIGLVGLGGIGKRMAELCKVLGMNVICWTFHPTEERAREIGIRFTSLEDLLGTSDVVSLHLPYTEKTKSFIGKKELMLMKEHSFLINTARAEIVDTQALVEVLAANQIAGAGIDVFDEEPISSDHPLLLLPNVILTPHTGFNTPEATEEILKIAIQNLCKFFKNKIQNAVN